MIPYSTLNPQPSTLPDATCYTTQLVFARRANSLRRRGTKGILQYLRTYSYLLWYLGTYLDRYALARARARARGWTAGLTRKSQDSGGSQPRKLWCWYECS